jgi:biotin synthase
VRRASVGDAVHLRGLIEISNICLRDCGYCGLRASQPGVPRYRMTQYEIIHAAQQAIALGYQTVVLQAGEDPGITGDCLAAVIRELRRLAPDIAITLSLGERSAEELALWREAGADRYLLRFETSDRSLFHAIHPPRPDHPVIHRLELLPAIRKAGYETGSGVMVGIPGQSWSSLANDLRLFAQMDLDMIGIGPFIPVPGTPLANTVPAATRPLASSEQVPADPGTTFKVMALTRLLCPEANIPATTALATLDPDQGRLLALQRGANVVMPNFTPARYRELYAIYPDKSILSEVAEVEDQIGHSQLRQQLRSIGRTVGLDKGSRAKAR